MGTVRVALVFGVSLVGCAAEPSAPSSVRGGDFFASPPIGIAVGAPLPQVPCTIEVEGVGTLDIEADYLPQVVYCENNGAGPQALAAQAISARSVAYYAIFHTGSICDGTDCQVYSCGGTAGPQHREAVEATAHEYLLFGDTLTYGFYVAGDPAAAPPGCVGDLSAPTEQWVTYNEGLLGTEVQQTQLGWVFEPGDPGYGQNRGCMSQWGARCLEGEVDYDADAILRFFYGDDIVVATATPVCDGATSTGIADGTGSDDGDAETETSSGEDDDGAVTTADTVGSDGQSESTSTSGTSTDAPSDGSVSTAGSSDSSTSAGDEAGLDEPPDFFSGSCSCRPATPSGWGAIAFALLTVGRMRRRRSPCPSDPPR